MHSSSVKPHMPPPPPPPLDLRELPDLRRAGATVGPLPSARCAISSARGVSSRLLRLARAATSCRPASESPSSGSVAAKLSRPW
eukprot:812028-Prymnesium_polylepis.1